MAVPQHREAAAAVAGAWRERPTEGTCALDGAPFARTFAKATLDTLPASGVLQITDARRERVLARVPCGDKALNTILDLLADAQVTEIWKLALLQVRGVEGQGWG